MLVARSLLLFALAAVAEIGGAYLVWLGLRHDRGWLLVGLGVIGLGAYGVIATFQPDPNFGRVFAAYGGLLGGSPPPVNPWPPGRPGCRPPPWSHLESV